MRAGNPEVAAQKPTARSSVSNGRDILPDAWHRTSVHPSRTPDTGNRREVAIRFAADSRRSCTVTTISGCVGLILRMRRSRQTRNGI